MAYLASQSDHSYSHGNAHTQPDMSHLPCVAPPDTLQPIGVQRVDDVNLHRTTCR